MTDESLDPPHVPGSSTTDTDDDLLRVLAIRLLAPNYPGAPASEPELVLGRLPGNLPIDVPIPEGSRVIGSLVQYQQTRGSRSARIGETTIVIDTDLSPEGVLSLYRQRLRAAGWRERGFPGAEHGFVFTPTADHLRVLFCRSAEGPSLWLNATAIPTGPTQVRVELDVDRHRSPCADHEGPENVAALIPALTPPHGSEQIRSGGGSSLDQAHSSAVLGTELELSTVASDYMSQLERAGWVLVEAGESGSLAWSTWSLGQQQGQSWQALLTILRRPDKAYQCLLDLRLERAESQSSHGR